MVQWFGVLNALTKGLDSILSTHKLAAGSDFSS